MEWYFIPMIVLGFLTILILSFYWWYRINFTPIPTGNIPGNIICIKNRMMNVFIYSKGSDRIAIDAGFSVRGLRKELMKINIKPETITTVFITHSDPDHIGGLSLFNKAKVYFGAGSKVKKTENYDFVEDNTQVMVGTIKIQAISTPGHRLGHTCYLIDDNYLFSGDLLRLKANEVIPFFKFISADHNQILESIKKVAKIDKVQMLLTAHTGYTIEFEQAIEKWRTP